jgi:spermidine/putrescine-binding protein
MTDHDPLWAAMPMNRRVVLQRAGLGVVLFAGAGSLLAACGGDDSGESSSGDFPRPTADEIAAAAGNVSVLGWSYYESKANLPEGISSEWAYLTTNEDTLTKTTQPGQFDAVTIYQGQIDQLRKVDRIIPIDVSLLQNWGEMSQLFQDAEVIRRDGEVWAVPYKWGFAFTHFRNDKVTSPPEEFEALMDPSLEGRIGLPDDPYAVISTFAFFAGYGDNANALSKDEFDETISLLNEFKKQVKTVHAYGEEAQLLSRGDIWVDLPSFSGALVEARKAKLDTGFRYLGAWSYVDCWMVLKDGGNLAGTYAMLDQSLTPEAQLETTKTSLANPVVDSAVSGLPEELQYASADEVLENAPLLPGVTVEEGGDVVPFQDWLDAWEQFKSA